VAANLTLTLMPLQSVNDLCLDSAAPYNHVRADGLPPAALLWYARLGVKQSGVVKYVLATVWRQPLQPPRIIAGVCVGRGRAWVKQGWACFSLPRQGNHRQMVAMPAHSHPYVEVLCKTCCNGPAGPASTCRSSGTSMKWFRVLLHQRGAPPRRLLGAAGSVYMADQRAVTCNANGFELRLFTFKSALEVLGLLRARFGPRTATCMQDTHRHRASLRPGAVHRQALGKWDIQFKLAWDIMYTVVYRSGPLAVTTPSNPQELLSPQLT
jgi:hypothetical protein